MEKEKAKHSKLFVFETQFRNIRPKNLVLKNVFLEIVSTFKKHKLLCHSQP